MSVADGLVGVFNKGEIRIISINCKKLLEEEHINSVREQILEVIDKSISPKIVIDFSAVEFLSSAMLGALIRIKKAVDDKNGKLALCEIQSSIKKIFKITSLDKLFNIYGKSEKALKNVESD